MNLFAGIGKIVDAYLNGRVFKFNLIIQQKRPCFVPCVLFDPTDEVKEFIQNLQTTEQLVWVQGKVASYEFESHGKTIRKIEVVTFPKSIITI